MGSRWLPGVSTSKITEGMMLWSFRRSIKGHAAPERRQDRPLSFIHGGRQTTLAFSMDYLSGGNLEDIASRGWTLQKRWTYSRMSVAPWRLRMQGHHPPRYQAGQRGVERTRQPVLTDFDISDIKYLTKLSVARGAWEPRCSPLQNSWKDVQQGHRALRHIQPGPRALLPAP